MSQYKYIGKRIGRVDGYEKADGSLKYMTDLTFPNALYGKTVRAPYAHAVIKSINIDTAKQMPGVVDVFTAKDIPGVNLQGNLGIKNMPVFAQDKMRYLGDALAFVVAETQEQADAAAKAVTVDYDPLPVYTDPVEAMKEDAVPIVGDSNILDYADAEYGDVDKAFAEADYVFEAEFRTPRHHQGYIETLGGWAVPEEDGSVSIYFPSQNPYGDIRQLSAILDLPENMIHIIGSPGGGSFGGKDYLFSQPHLALAALKTGRPVFCHLDREETMLTAVSNIPFIYRIRTAVNKDGMLQGQDVEVICDNGAYIGLGLIVAHGAIENGSGPYHFPAMRGKAWTVNTNQQYTGEWRGFGNNQTHLAVETIMDEIAEKLDMDPLELRMKNALRSGDSHSLGHELSCAVDGAYRTMKAAYNSDTWKNKDDFLKEETKPWIKRGIGVSSAMQPFTENYVHNSGLSVDENGNFTVHTSLTEHGAGSGTAFCIMTAELMGVPLSRVYLDNGKSSCSAESGPITGARSNYAIGKTTIMCVEKLTSRIVDCAAEIYSRNPDEIKLVDGEVITSDGETLDFGRICRTLVEKGINRVDSQLTIQHPVAEGNLPDRHKLWTFMTQITGVEVNVLTGKTDVVFADCYVDAGRVVNPLGFEGQVEGGMMMGFGMTLTEDMITDPATAKLRAGSLQTYLLPTVKDIPKFSITSMPCLEETGPFGAKGIGEIPAVPIVPGVCNGIYDAVGVRMRELPVIPERLFMALQEKRASE